VPQRNHSEAVRCSPAPGGADCRGPTVGPAGTRVRLVGAAPRGYGRCGRGWRWSRARGLGECHRSAVDQPAV